MWLWMISDVIFHFMKDENDSDVSEETDEEDEESDDDNENDSEEEQLPAKKISNLERNKTE